MSLNVEFRHLSYFIAVAEERSFVRAAKRLHVSQPTLTTQIRQIEEDIDAKLLIRGSAGSDLSPAGKEFLCLARQLLDLRESGARKTSAIHHGHDKSFRFGWSPFVSRGMVREAMDAYKELAPSGQSEQFSDSSANLAKMVLTGRIDAALVTVPVGGRELLKQKICSERYMVCLRDDDPHAKTPTLSQECVSAHLRVFVARSQNPLFSDRIREKLTAAGIRITATHTVTTPADLQFHVQAGNGWALVHESLKLDSGLTIRPIEGLPLRVRTAFISRPSQEHPLLPMLAFRIATSCKNRPTELRKASAQKAT